jgi:hypothetical protein
MRIPRHTDITQDPLLELQSGRATFTIPGRATHRGGGLRGIIQNISEQSRRRLQRLFASIDYDTLAADKTPILFVALTTPREYWSRHTHLAASLERFFDRLEYSFGGILGLRFAIWRKEAGRKSGAIHFHLVVFGVPYLPAELLRTWWKESLQDTQARTIRVHVEPVETPERVARYLGKYCAKVAYDGKEAEVSTSIAPDEGGAGDVETSADPLSLSKAHILENDSSTGRWWGIRGRANVPWGTVLTFEGDFAKALAKRVRRIFRKWLKRKGTNPGFADRMRRHSGGFTALGTPSMLDKLMSWLAEQVAYDLYEATPF